MGFPVRGIPKYTWASKPAVANWPANTPIIITDVGPGGSLWHHNGVYWRPSNGAVDIARGIGSVASPLVTAAAGTSGVFSIPGGNPVIPAGLLLAGSSVLEIEGRVHKAGTNGTYIGYAAICITDLSPAALNLGEQQTTPASILDLRLMTSAWITGSTAFTVDDRVGPHTYNSDGYDDMTGAQMDTAQAMYVNFGFYNANAADTLSLVEYSVRVRV